MSVPFTDSQLREAAKNYVSAGSAPSWWGSSLQALSGSPNSSPSPSQATQAAANWISRLPKAQQSQSGGWTVATNAEGKQIYVNTSTGKTSTTNPGTPASSTPTVGDVSKYLQSLLNTGSGSLSGSLAGSGSSVGSIQGVSGSFRPSGSGSTYTQDGSRKSQATPITKDEATNTRTSDSTISDTPMESKASGPIVTLLDLTNRDIQENDMFPLRTEITWFTRDQERRLLPFSPVVQETALRGPAAFGQRFSFDLGSITIGDLLLGTALQIRLDHWLDPQTQNVFAAGKIDYKNRADAWEYANSLGTSIIQLAELEVDGKTLETIDSDFIHTFNALFNDYNTQVGIAYDHIGLLPTARLLNTTRRVNLFPVENGNLNCVLPFFFMRTKLREALPMIAIREGYVKIHITLRPFDECVRQMRGFRDTCTSVPPPTPVEFTFNTCQWTYDPAVLNGSWDIPPPFSFTYTRGDKTYNWSYSIETQRASWDTPPPISFTTASTYRWTASTQTWSPSPPPINIAYQDPVIPSKYYYWDGVPAAWRSGLGPPVQSGPPLFNFTYGNNLWTSVVGDWSVAAPAFKSVHLLTYGAIVDGSFRSKMLHDPFEILHRQVQTFYFDEPLKYTIGKRQDAIRIQLPLEANHPLEEIIWFVRRKGTNNEWTNFTGVLETEWTPRKAQVPMLQNAIVQANGTVLCDADEQFYREGISSAHRGGFAAYSRFIYGYSFAKTPGDHQPSGSLNASRLNSLRLTLDVLTPAANAAWEVKVFCIGMNWLRFENGLANPMFDN